MLWLGEGHRAAIESKAHGTVRRPACVAAVPRLPNTNRPQVRHWGLSNETTYGVCRMAETAARLGLPPPISIQNDFSLLDRRFEGHLAEACAPTHYNVGLLVRQ